MKTARAETTLQKLLDNQSARKQRRATIAEKALAVARTSKERRLKPRKYASRIRG
jgi:hypothetical protein